MNVSLNYYFFIINLKIFIYSSIYTKKQNTIEMWFNQIKHTLKLNKKVLKFNELRLEVKKSIRKVKNYNYENYFEYTYNK